MLSAASWNNAMLGQIAAFSCHREKYLNTEGGVATPAGSPNARAATVTLPRRGNGEAYRADEGAGVDPSSVYLIVALETTPRGNASHTLATPPWIVIIPPEGMVRHAPVQPPLTTPSKFRLGSALRYSRG